MTTTNHSPIPDANFGFKATTRLIVAFKYDTIQAMDSLADRLNLTLG